MIELLSMPASSAAAEAPHLLCLADELGLTQLRRAAVAFIAQNYNDVQVQHLPNPGCSAIYDFHTADGLDSKAVAMSIAFLSQMCLAAHCSTCNSLHHEDAIAV